jgi:hypothetical protein
VPESEFAAEPKRTLRRGVAVLLIPTCLLLVQAEFVGSVPSGLPGASRAVGAALLVVAVAYLVVSAARQVAVAADTPF